MKINEALKIDTNYYFAHYHSCPILESVGKFDEAKKCLFTYGDVTKTWKNQKITDDKTEIAKTNNSVEETITNSSKEDKV